MGRVGARGLLVAGAVVAAWVALSWVPPSSAEPMTELATAAVTPLAASEGAAPDSGAPAPTEPPPPSPASTVAPPIRPALVTTVPNPTVPPTSPPPSSTTVGPPPSSMAAPRVAPVTTTDPVDGALERMRFDWVGRFPDWEVDFLGSRQGLRALTYPHERRIEVFVRPTDTAESLHRVLAHEIGHLVDVELNTNADRDRWRSQRGMSAGVPWWPDDSDPDFASGAGDFAEAFAVWEAGITSESTVAGPPTAEDLVLLRELLES